MPDRNLMATSAKLFIFSPKCRFTGPFVEGITGLV
jgi:hypothetical protein